MSPTEPDVEGSGGLITALTPQKRATDRYSLFIDGTFVLGLGVDVVIEFGLSPGMRIDPELLLSITTREEIAGATNAALHLLAYRARASGELQTRLRQKGFSPEAIEAAIDKLASWNYLDDKAFAQSWVEQQQTHRPRSRRAMVQDLRSRGIEPDTISETLDAADIDEVQDAIRASARKWESWRALPEDVRLRRLSGFLARRGYGYDIVRQVHNHFTTDEVDE
ncbi:MAG: RecX family transcriptional regulator [Thermomicrobiales bacterium]